MSRQSKQNELMLPHEYLQRILHYDPATGVFTYKLCNSHRTQQQPGDVAGCLNAHGYRYIKIRGILYKAARLAIFYMTGTWPIGEVDHIDGIKSNDAFSNLRSLSSQENCRNNKAARDNPYHGVCRSGKKYTVQFRVDYKIKYFGSFPDKESARLAAVAAKKSLGLYDHVQE